MAGVFRFRKRGWSRKNLLGEPVSRWTQCRAVGYGGPGKGEGSSLDEREWVVYFTLGDSEDGSTLNCLMFRSAYQLSGVRLAAGDEGCGRIAGYLQAEWKIVSKVGYLELSGEGALKKAYDELWETYDGRTPGSWSGNGYYLHFRHAWHSSHPEQGRLSGSFYDESRATGSSGGFIRRA